MGKKVVTAAREAGCENAIGFYRLLDGWRVSGWGVEVREAVVRQVESEMTLLYYLADE
jgi:hypothetical protein